MRCLSVFVVAVVGLNIRLVYDSPVRLSYIVTVCLILCNIDKAIVGYRCS